MEIEELTQEQKLEIAKILSDNADHPLQTLYTRLFKQALDSHYYTLAHLPYTDSLEKKMQKIGNISGRIAELESIMQIPENYRTFVEDVKKEDKK